MQLISTRKQAAPVSFLQAMQKGLADDGGLYVPEHLFRLPPSFWETLTNRSFQEIGFEIARLFLGNEIDDDSLRTVVEDTLNFEVPLVPLSDQLYILELFHGPTLAFKDFGARFMARLFTRQAKALDRDVVILVATSGDTGGAVARGFYDVPGIKVCLLYPKNKVSTLQQKQMATLGGNIHALEVSGTFDHCQRMVKQAFGNTALNQNIALSSANSINIARLLPQSFYYVYGLAQLRKEDDRAPLFSVPSGNFGNLTAGLMAMKMGMPAAHFLAATNRNDVVPQYLAGNAFQPRPSQSTISNAMDVGDPSNFERIQYLFDQSDKKIRNQIWGHAFSDESTRQCIAKIYEETAYMLDPHTAVGVLAAQKYRELKKNTAPAIVLGTAHPAKFTEVVEPLIDQPVEIPDTLSRCMDKKIANTSIEPEFEELKSYLLNHFGE